MKKLLNWQVLFISVALVFATVTNLKAQQVVVEGAPVTNPSPSETPKSDKDFVDNLKFTFEIGARYKHVTGDRASKFEEYGQVRKGLWVRRFSVSSNPPESPEYFRVFGSNAGENDQKYLFEYGKYGSFRTRIDWTSNTHLYSRGSKSLFVRGYDVLEVNDIVRTTLQGTADPLVPATLQGFLSNAPEITLQTKRGTLNFNQRFHITKNWLVRFNWMRQERSGVRPLGSGSYERIGSPTGDTFRVHSIELPAPTDSTTDEITVGTSFSKRKWGVSFDYIFSNYKNNVQSLTYDNPFRFTDLQATGSGGTTDRMKMARGLVSFEPSNSSQTLAVSAFVDLPYDTRVAGAWSWSFWRQNEQFFPYTLNTAIVSGVPAGLNITSAASLPEDGLDGKVDIFTQDYLIASRPWKNWTFNLHYRRYDNDNKTHPIHFPGYVAYLDSYWRTNIAGLPIENEVQSFTRSNTSAEAIWDISKKFRWRVGYEWEGWVREHRQAAKTTEHKVSTQFTFNPRGRFSSRLSYLYSTKDPGFYDQGIKEFNQLRMFDQARRIRNDVDWQWQYAVNTKLGFSGNAGYSADDYDQHFFGLARYTQWYGNADMLYMPKENTTFYLNYSREQYKYSIQQIAKTAVPYALQNRWNRDEKDTLDNFGAGVTAYALKEKLLFDVHYIFSNADTKLTTVNPDIPLANSVLNATAFPLPDIKSKLHELNSDISYQFDNNWGIGFKYIYQPYTLDDFAWNGLSPYPFSSLTSEQDGRRFLLLDSRYTSHNAHVFGVYIRFGK